MHSFSTTNVDCKVTSDVCCDERRDGSVLPDSAYAGAPSDACSQTKLTRRTTCSKPPKLQVAARRIDSNLRIVRTDPTIIGYPKTCTFPLDQVQPVVITLVKQPLIDQIAYRCGGGGGSNDANINGCDGGAWCSISVGRRTTKLQDFSSSYLPMTLGHEFSLWTKVG